MPLYKKLSPSKDTSIYLWYINEESNDLKENLILSETSLERMARMKSEKQIKEFLAVRKLLNFINYSDADLNYDAFGKPYLKDKKNISISHSNEFACVIISENNVGIDIELKSEKILKSIGFLFNEEFILQFNGNKKDAITLTSFCWAIKEAIFKLIPENDISIKENISIQPFQINENPCTVKVEIASKTTSYQVQLEEIEDYVLAYVIQ